MANDRYRPRADIHLTTKLSGGPRAKDVRDGEARGVPQLHAVDDDRRIEHAQTDPEHADAQEVGDELLGG
ncbi:MAG TPA: hypothetical protein VK138_14375, partial [Acidiferrobacterales bacterium]|nr:hypothetical protein [Acidiferrobacterales bacterium]